MRETSMKSSLNLLINLAVTDKKIGEVEEKLIYKIGEISGLTKEEIKQMIEYPQPVGDLSHFTEDQQFESLFYLVQLMKKDGAVMKSEISFCEKAADKLGFRKSVVAEMSTYVFKNNNVNMDRKALMDIAKRFKK